MERCKKEALKEEEDKNKSDLEEKRGNDGKKGKSERKREGKKKRETWIDRKGAKAGEIIKRE